MAYQVIARKWRPQTFDEVTGQEPITRTLRNAIEHRRLHHAYLFSGARGVGKTTSARLLAKALNCHKSPEPTPTPCRSDDPTACPSCREITESRSIDVQEIDAASNTGVDNVRDAIIASVGIAPARDRYKIFIIDEVHMLSGAAFNALLKTLEEPPPRVVFIMATTEKHKVPETILSRCQQFEFRTIATAKILERLKLIAKEEKISIPEDALREIARTGEGSMRDAQSALDQVISFAGTKIKKEDVEMALGVAGADILTRIIDSIANNQPAAAITVVDDIVMRGHDLRNFCRDLLAHFRDLLVTKVSGKEELLESAVCDIAELKRQAALFSESDLVRFFHSLSETETKLRAATQPRYQLEVGIVKLMELRGVETIGELLQRLNALEGGSGSGSPSTQSSAGSVASSQSPSRPAGSSFAAAAAPAMETPQPRESASPIDRVKDLLDSRQPRLSAALHDAKLVTLENGELYVEFAPTVSRYLTEPLSDPKNSKFLADLCREVTGQETRINIQLKDPRAATEPLSKQDEERIEKQSLFAEAESDPAVQVPLKTLRGHITSVVRDPEHR
ncbi:MAG TPA: DNA polymerase III subunit gamma/tau [Pyrinomonadaceae bacterium]|jgi:DNA polymerase-3 subunit gamma/tau|nr:DNA polymerase III subunit gamma/tau [Pyrinomonadaceae bacterium]